MDWRTELQINPSKDKITLSDKIFTIGSCFSDEIGAKLAENKFSVCRNPFGTVYNPLSIHQLIYYSLFKISPPGDHYAQNADVHFNYDFHSSFSSLDKNELKNKIVNSIDRANHFLENTQRLVITYGTAFAYFLKSKDVVVANCHKMPTAYFYKELLNESTIVGSFKNLYQQVKEKMPSLKIILTVSPVRHLKDTLELNAVSKSILRTACYTIANQFPDVDYFPAYEILLDDLRDYRFYKTDRIHPTDEAVNYIWQKFYEMYFDEKTQKFISEWQKIKSDLDHKPFLSESVSHQKFLNSLLKKLETLKDQIDVTEEIARVKSYCVIRNS